MRALLLVAHGSRRPQSNEEVRDLAVRLQQHCHAQYPIIQAAFLELADPSIVEGIKKCIRLGAKSVVVLPYFLNSGRHVVEDIPHFVAQAQRDHPEIDIKVSPHLGASEQMLDLLITTANSSQIDEAVEGEVAQR